MKICFVAPRLHTNQHAWIDTLQAHEHDVLFLVAGDKTLPHTQHPTYQTISIPFKKAVFFVRWPLTVLLRILNKPARSTFFKFPNRAKLYNVLKEEQPDVIIVRDASSPLSLTAFAMAKKLDIKAILYNQHPLEVKEKFHIRFLQYIGLVPQHRITPIRYEQNNQTNQKKNAYYVPLIPTFTPQAPSEKDPGEPLKLLFVGKYVLQRKRHLQAVRAVHRAIENGADIEFTVAGGYNPNNTRIYDELVKYIQTHELEKYINLETTIDHYDMPELYKAHDVFFFPSIDEPFSISVLEAMAFGLVPIVTDSNGAASCLKQGTTGFTVPSDDIQANVEILETLAKKPETVTKIGYNAYSYISKKHNQDAAYQNLLTAIEN